MKPSQKEDKEYEFRVLTRKEIRQKRKDGIRQTNPFLAIAEEQEKKIQKHKPKNKKTIVKEKIIGCIGYGVGIISIGIAFLIAQIDLIYIIILPLGSMLLSRWALSKFIKDREIYIPCISVQLGHILWMLFGLIASLFFYRGVYEGFDLFISGIYIIITIIILAWILIKPSAISLLFILAVQVIGIIYNIVDIVQSKNMPLIITTGLAIHIFIRLLAIALIIIAYDRTLIQRGREKEANN